MSEPARLVAIRGGDLGLTLALPARGMPEIVAFGPALEGGDARALVRSPRVNGMDAPGAAALLLPTGGLGFFGWPAIQGHREGRDFVQEFANWHVEAAADRLRLTGEDDAARLGITLDLALSKEGILSMRSAIRNRGDAPFTLDRCMAGSVLVDFAAPEVLTFDGTWGREFQLRREALGSALWAKESRRGRTSHDRFPGLVVSAAEDRSEIIGLHLAFSGNHAIVIDRLDDRRRLVHAGELFEPGEVRLGPGESYSSPTLYVSRAENLAALSSRFHAFLRRDVLAWPGGAMRPRPVTLNTWEGTYFAHDQQILVEQARAAAALGIERFVLDDGWFGRRDDDTSSLGDWVVDPRKYPEGLGPLIEAVRAAGMEFGLWIEPEMVSPDSDLFRAHPDWALQIAGRPLRLSRHQLVLDLTRNDVTDFLFARIAALLSAHPIAYLKWDMNRDLTQAGDAAGRAATGRQTRALYALIDRIRAAYPEVEIESCASGGGRADYAILARTHRLWTSDCTDALERLAIQRGASIFFPPEILGAHVSAAPNHQTGRRHSLAFRALVALPYHFGIELNPLALDVDAQRELAGFIALHKRLRGLFHAGAILPCAGQDGRHAYAVISADGRHATAILAQGAQMIAEQPQPLRVPLPAAARYRVTMPAPQMPSFIRAAPEALAVLSGKVALSGGFITEVGLLVPPMKPESAILIEFEAVEG